jgi:hypothetical protein
LLFKCNLHRYTEALAYMNEAYHRQGAWFEEVLIPMLAAHPLPTVCLFGNSDWGGLMPRCQAAARAAGEAAGSPARVRFVEGDGDLFTVQTLARRDDHGDGDGFRGAPVAVVDVLSCSLVPLCAHKKKDWERIDTRDLDETMARAPYMDPEGFVSTLTGAVRRRLELTEESARDDSIEAALERLVSRWEERRTKRQQQQQQQQRGGGGVVGVKRKADSDDGAAPVEAPEKGEKEEDEDATPSTTPSSSVPPVWVIHAPPRDTVGDLCDGGDHVGSIAIRRAIERWQPRFTLHGHIHESVRLHGGKFTQVLGGGSGAGSKGGAGSGAGSGSGGGGEGGDEGGQGSEAGGGSLVMSVGNDYRDPNPHCVIVRTDQPNDAVRVECAAAPSDESESK